MAYEIRKLVQPEGRRLVLTEYAIAIWLIYELLHKQSSRLLAYLLSSGWSVETPPRWISAPES